MKRHPIKVLLGWLLVVAGVTVFLGPILWLASSSFKPDALIHAHVDSWKAVVPIPFTLENYVNAMRRSHLAISLLNTFVVVGLVAVGGLLINTPAAFAFARMRFFAQELILVLVVATLIIPLEVIVVPLFMTVRVSTGLIPYTGEWVWTMGALSVPFFAKAFNIFLLRQYFLALPRSLEEAAFIDGLGWFGVFWRIAVPNAKPALVTVVLFDFVIHWNDFLWPLVISQDELTRTIQLGLANFFTQPPISWGAILAYSLLATLPLILVFIVGQRWIIRSVVSSGMKH